jgi:hypothetical protein
MSILTLNIEVCGNPDRGQNPAKPPFGVDRITTIRASRIEIIRLMMEEFQAKHYLGGGNWKKATLFDGDRKVGRVSWNGRVWGDDGKDGKEVLL